jgi:hypothetical protein
MNPKPKVGSLESRTALVAVLLVMKNGTKRVIGAETIMSAHQALLKRAEAWHNTGGAFPLPDHVIAEIPMLRELLDSVDVERDLVAKFPQIPVAPVIASIRLTIQCAPREIATDPEGEYMMLPSVAGPIRIRFVKPKHEKAA